ncbi:hypothetical protein JOQ06_009121, partial [Pogonophryne albipinna]
MRVAYAQAGVGKSRGAMYFPFINMLPCPPNAQGVRNGRVHCCPQCHFILEEIWGAYRLSLSEDLITSVSSFLVRYHAAMAIEGSGPAHSQTAVASRPCSSMSVCYLCGGELCAGGEYQLHVKPAWAFANPQPPSSPWARQYSCEAFVCFFCRKEQHRKGRLCAVTVARLPVFLYAPRSTRTLLVDDGRRLVIGACVECKAMVQVGQSMQQDRDRLGHGSSDGEKREPESALLQTRHKNQAE